MQPDFSEFTYGFACIGKGDAKEAKRTSPCFQGPSCWRRYISPVSVRRSLSIDMRSTKYINFVSLKYVKRPKD